MGHDPGRGGSRSDEPPPLATVRHLHLDDVDGSGVTVTDEWYETERLTGHITGGAERATTSDRPAPAQQEAAVLLDWRHAATVVPPTRLERLGRSLADRRRRLRHAGVRSLPRTRGARQAVVAAESSAGPPTQAPHEDGPAADELHAAAASGPRIGLREAADQALQRSRRRYALSAEDRERRTPPRPRAAAIVIAVVLSLTMVSVIGIVVETSRTIARPHRASPIAATSRTGDVGLTIAAMSVTGGLESLALQAAANQRDHRALRAHQRTRHVARGRVRHSGRRSAISRHHSSPPVTTPPTAPRASSSASLSPIGTSSYSRSSSSPAYSAQPAAREPAPATTKRVPLPAGPIGPGGTVGNNCNPKCS